MSNQCQQLACSQNTLKKYVDKKTLIFKEMNSNGSGEKMVRNKIISLNKAYYSHYLPI